MRYPTVSLSELEMLSGLLLAGKPIDLPNSVKWTGQGAEIELAEVSATCRQITSDLIDFRESDDARLRDLFEGKSAGPLHATLKDLPLAVLDDPGFWRYVGVAHLWDLIVWRESKTFEKDWAKYRIYIDGRKHAECVPLRMFLRGQISLDSNGGYRASSEVPEGTDLWRSHIVRVRTSYIPPLARGLVDQVATHKIATDPLRAYARRINRVRSNVTLQLYTEDEIVKLLDEQRVEQDPTS